MAWYDDMRGGPAWIQSCKQCGRTTYNQDFVNDLCPVCEIEEIECPSCGDTMALGELNRYGKCKICRMSLAEFDRQVKLGLIKESV